ncbi:NAD(P)/FAD-dependent oxidoreductase [Amycolatopsis pigmentata]|uniref:NAD(P)/FAD-dependent oxidoreductase n=1 Tax=Amycolatopsis pigmentata TaxID=450801 RepID=A0ABW5G3I0_9PSEU
MALSVLIIGAGVIGASLAGELAGRGVTVTVIDAAQAGSGTSAATFGWVNSNGKSPAAYSRLNLLGLQAHERAAGSAGGAPWFHQIGNVELARTDAELAAIEDKVARLSAETYEATLLTAAEIRRLEPSLNTSRLAGGALYPREGWIDAITMCTALLASAGHRGAAFRPFEKVERIDGDSVTTMSADGSVNRYEADLIVLAAGNGTRQILAGAGIDFPIVDTAAGGTRQMPSVGLISTSSPVRSGPRHVINAEGIAMRPARNGGITFTDLPTAGRWDPADPGIWTVPGTLLDRARELYPALDAMTQTVDLGLRVLPEDGLTISDWVTESVYAIATHSGVTLAAHLADVVATELLTGRRDDSLHDFGLARFANAR